MKLLNFAVWAHSLLDRLRAADWLAPLAMRLYLVPIFWQAGINKFENFSDIVDWFGSMDMGLGLPLPYVMATLATGAELVGAASLLLGLGLRWMCIPMMVTMIVAILTVHLPNGWLAVSEGMGPFATERTMHAIERLNEIKDLVREHGDYDRLTEYGPIVILNNGVEFAATYFIMLLSLFFTGAGRFVSVDYWLRRRFMPQAVRAN
ncbi:MAG TPA: DoxX family protein [Nevskiaceae bacterium]|nr:DoxX family protein [Nevskiaceae bacterium]